jgi:hypothetical protein
MATSGEHKSFYVLDFHVNKSVVSVQRHFRTKFGTDTPSSKSIRKWYLQFQDTGCICKRKPTGRPCSFGESKTDALATTFSRSHPVLFLLVGFHRGSCFCTATSSDAGWLAHAHHSSHHSDWPRHAIKSLAGIWLPVWCVSCYGWSIQLNICNVPEKKISEFSFPSILILFTCVTLNSSNILLKSGTSFWLAL